MKPLLAERSDQDALLAFVLNIQLAVAARIVLHRLTVAKPQIDR